MTDDRAVTGRINSVETLGAIDGPGLRYVVFLQGCNLRCGCCHNPDTWDTAGGTAESAGAIADRLFNYREYFGKNGGITVSGGEPLLQPEFVLSLFKLCKQKGINTCLDTSGCILTDRVKELLSYTDYVMLDIKYTTDGFYKKYVGCGIEKPLRFLSYLNERQIPTRIRQVIIPGLNDNAENIRALAGIIRDNTCIVKTELLPFRKICEVKYKKLQTEFPFSVFPEATSAEIVRLEETLNKYLG